MNRLFITSLLSLIVGLNCNAQVVTRKSLNTKANDTPQSIPMQQKQDENSNKEYSTPVHDMPQINPMSGMVPQNVSQAKDSRNNGLRGKVGGPMRGGNIKQLEMRINTNDEIARKIRERQRELIDKFEDRKGIGNYLLSGVLTTGSSILFSAVDEAIGAGVTALIKTFKGHHDDWRLMNQKENTRKDSLYMCAQVNDFYSRFSNNGALDPDGMQFDGITLEKKDDGKTIFKLVTHLDTSKEGLDKIIGHSKFSLVVDTLFFDIKNCGLPNRESVGMPTSDEKSYFSFDTRKSISEKITLSITSSYISPAIEVFKDVKLGTFDINLQGLEAKDTLDGYVYRYERGNTIIKDKEPIITGECFIVPRSYNGMRDENNTYHELYGLGEYKVDAVLVTTCQNTPEFEKNWKDDWRAYQERQKRLKEGKSPNGGGSKNWVVQYFDTNYKSWVTKMIKAPVSSSQSYINQLIQDKTGTGQMGGRMGGMNGKPGEMMDGNGMQQGPLEGDQGGGAPLGNQEKGAPQEGAGQGKPQGIENPPGK